MADLLTRRRPSVIDPTSPSSEPFRSLHLAVKMRPTARSGNAVMFTSPAPGAGKSTMAVNYALVAALSDTRVLLVDADLSRSTLHHSFSVPRAPGLSDELLRFETTPEARLEMAFPEATHSISSTGSLELLPAGAPVTRPSDLTGSQHMANLLKRARMDYDLVVIDSPPVLGPADASSLASQPGTDVVVVVSQTSKRRPLIRALRQLELVQANVLGVVLNRATGLASYEYEY